MRIVKKLGWTRVWFYRMRNSFVDERICNANLFYFKLKNKELQLNNLNKRRLEGEDIRKFYNKRITRFWLMEHDYCLKKNFRKGNSNNIFLLIGWEHIQITIFSNEPITVARLSFQTNKFRFWFLNGVLNQYRKELAEWYECTDLKIISVISVSITK